MRPFQPQQQNGNMRRKVMIFMTIPIQPNREPMETESQRSFRIHFCNTCPLQVVTTQYDGVDKMSKYMDIMKERLT